MNLSGEIISSRIQERLLDDMKKLLFVNSCPRGSESRTLQLAHAFLQEADANQWEVITHDLNTMGLRSVDAETLAVKEPLCDARAWDHPLFKHTLEFQQADMVVIAAPYWDLSFPSILKVWVENMYARNLTFHYEDDRCIGMCKGTEAVYITTSGSPIRENDWGTGYIKAVLHELGIQSFTSIKAEGLDLVGNDAQKIMEAAKAEAVKEAKRLLAK